MKKLVVLIILGMVLWTFYSFFTSQKNKEQTQPEKIFEQVKKSEPDKQQAITGLEIGNQAPEIVLQTLDGKTVKLSDFVGQPVVLNFFATWCPPCQAEMPDIEQFYKENKGMVLAVDLFSTEKSSQSVTDFVGKYELTFPILLDEQEVSAQRYMIRAVPTTYLIDSEGKIAFRFYGSLNYGALISEFQKLH